jgi:serine-type D-Ala-D-Ala carboxypeptidase (penicillin-binding protein 5/6)
MGLFRPFGLTLGTVLDYHRRTATVSNAASSVRPRLRAEPPLAITPKPAAQSRPIDTRRRAGRLAGVALMLAIVVAAPVRAQEVPKLQIHSKRYIVIDADTGEVFAQKNAHQEVAIASLTKVFTAIEALERGNLDQSITTRESDVFDPNSSTVMGFGAGETFSLRDLLYGMMLPSGNDAAHAIARSLGDDSGGSDDQAVNRFVGYMNERVKDMGLTETHLLRPDGWGVKGHYSSAHDLAAFTMYALRYPMFVDLISTAQYTTEDGSLTVTNTNKMLNTYPDLVGGKTGYDEDAGYCLIEVARRNGNTMISVTLDGIPDNSDWYDDNRVLLDYAFDQQEAETGAHRQPTGEVLTFRDPDAVLVSAQATPGASIGARPPTATPASSPTAAIAATPTVVGGVAASHGSGGSNDNVLIAIVVSAVVIAVGVGSVLGGASRGKTAPTD